MTLSLKDVLFVCSSYEGWDNPFRPEGEISHDADELLRLWKEGKLALKNGGGGGLDASDHDQQQQQLPTSSLDSEVKTPLISQTETSINGNRWDMSLFENISTKLLPITCSRRFFVCVSSF